MLIRWITFGFALAAVLVSSAHAQTVLHVDVGSPNDGPGHDWEHGFHYLQDALAAASLPGVDYEIRVAVGIHRPDESSANPTGTGDREATFELMTDVVLLGGYAGYGAADPDERNVELYQTILSGDLAENDAPADFPGGASCDDNSLHVVMSNSVEETAVLDGFTITAANADGEGGDSYGGGMYNSRGTPMVLNCTFLKNAAVGDSGGSGGGVYNNISSIVAMNCTFSGNVAGRIGGGMYNGYSNSVVINCRFIGNSLTGSSGKGAGVYNTSSDSVFANCLFSGNTAPSGNTYGSGMFNNSSDPLLTNCVIVGNYSYNDSGGISNQYSNPVLVNCIVWGNTREWGTDSQIADVLESATTATFSCIQGGTGQPWFGTGCTAANPRLVDANGPDNIYGTEDDDPHLQDNSPCIDTGDNVALPVDTQDLDGDGDTDEQLPWDLDGYPRRMNLLSAPDGGNGDPPIVDMGVYEYLVDCNNNKVPDVIDIAQGTSDDCNLNSVPDDCEIADGTSEDCNTNGVPDECDIDQGASLDCNVNGIPDDCEPDSDGDGIIDACEAIHNVTKDTWHSAIQQAIGAAADGDEIVVGPGTYDEQIDLSDKAVALRSLEGAELTIIDGDGDGPVVTCSGSEHSGAVLQGFTITGGESDRGGGMYITDADPTVVDCIFKENYAVMDSDVRGGGMYVFGGNPTINGCTFVSNIAGDPQASYSYGGGLYLEQGTATVINCRFLGNSSVVDTVALTVKAVGGGICVVSGNASVVNCTFSGNTLFARTFALPEYIASARGGGIAGIMADLTVVNCAFAGNSATASPTSHEALGGAVASEMVSAVTVANSIFFNNSAFPNGMDVYGSVAVSYSCVFPWTLSGTGIIREQPSFVDLAGLDGIVGTEDDDLHLTSESPCIDAGNNVAVPADSLDIDGDGDNSERVPFDLDGYPRFVDDPLVPDALVGTPPIVDMGVYEYRSADVDDDYDVDLMDHMIMMLCMFGPDEAPVGGCEIADLDDDGDVDLGDFLIVQLQFVAP